MDNFDVHQWNKYRYLSNINENEKFLEKLASGLSQKHPELDFDVKFGERIDVRGSQQDMFDFGNKMDGKKFGDYEVFHTDDEDRGEIVRIVKSKR
jgi:hypothetical protein